MATGVLRPHNILLPPQRIRATHRRPPNPSAATKSSPPASRRHHHRRSAPSSPSSKKIAASAVRPAVKVYAGSAFSMSPEPSSLPLPQFPVKKAASVVVAVVDDAATRNLRRILRLE